MPRLDNLSSWVFLFALSACSSSTSSDGGGADSGSGGGGGSGGAATGDAAPDAPAPAPRMAITTDWLSGSLSLLDYDALVAGATTRDEALIETIDLASDPPGPLQVEVTPDGKRALVAVGGGFFDGVAGLIIGVMSVPPGDGGLLVIDLETRAVEARLSPMHTPMGIAISPDSSTAYTANYGPNPSGTTLSVIDLDTLQVVADIDVGPFPEQVSLNEDGTLGAINTAGDGAIRVFQTSDVAGTLSAPLVVSEDPSDVTFVPGTNKLVVGNSRMPSAWSIVDVSDPANPVIDETAPEPGGVAYAATWIPGSTDVLIPLTTFATIDFYRLSVGGGTPSFDSFKVDGTGFPIGVAVAPDGTTALLGLPGDNQLMVVDLVAKTGRTIDWLSEAGPTYVAITP